jgi:hypothetical protein
MEVYIDAGIRHKWVHVGPHLGTFLVPIATTRRSSGARWCLISRVLPGTTETDSLAWSEIERYALHPDLGGHCKGDIVAVLLR